MGVFFAFQFSEEPLGDPGYNEEHNGRKNSKGYYKPYPEFAGEPSVMRPHNNGENNEYRRICEYSAPDSYGHGLVFGYPQFTHYGIGDQGVGGKHTCR